MRIASLLLALACALCHPAQAQMPDFTRLVREQAATVVSISGTAEAPASLPGSSIDDEPDEEAAAVREFLRRFFGGPVAPDTTALGAGFLISEDGVIVTNAHLAASATDLVVRLADRREFEARVLGIDPVSDIAVLKIEARGLPQVRIGDPRALQPGEWVAAIGSPFGFDRSVTVGVVSATERLVPEESYLSFIQTDVAVNPGNSGGPLFNALGEVVGVNSAIYSATGGYMGLSFAIPIDVALEAARELQRHGKVRRGRIGVQLQEVSADLARALRLPRAAGSLVVEVTQGGPAEKAGLRPGDVVLRFGADAIEGHADVVRFAARTVPGTQVELELMRFGEVRRLGVVVEEAVAPPAPAPSAAAGAGGRGENPTGLRLAPLDAEQKRQLGAREGLVVRYAEGPARRAGLDRGDIVVSVNGFPTGTLGAFNAAVARAGSGSTLALLVERNGVRRFVALRTHGG